MANQDIPIEMMHIDGKKNPSDFLSRERSEENDANSHDLADMDLSDALDSYLVQVIQEYENLSPIKISTIKKMTLKDPVLQFLKQRIIRHDFNKHQQDPRIKPFLSVKHELTIIDQIVMKGSNCIVLPEDLQPRAVSLVHHLAHQGMTSSEKLLTTKFWFPSFSTIARAEVDMCLLCKHTVGSNRKEPAGLTPTPPKPFHTIAMDFKGPLKDSSYALVMLDLYSKWPEVY